MDWNGALVLVWAAKVKASLDMLGWTQNTCGMGRRQGGTPACVMGSFPKQRSVGVFSGSLEGTHRDQLDSWDCDSGVPLRLGVGQVQKVPGPGRCGRI